MKYDRGDSFPFDFGNGIPFGSKSIAKVSRGVIFHSVWKETEIYPPSVVVLFGASVKIDTRQRSQDGCACKGLRGEARKHESWGQFSFRF